MGAEQGSTSRRRDYRTGALTAGIIVLSLLLGWMVGRAGWSMAVHRAEAENPPIPPDLAAAAAQVNPQPVIPEPAPLAPSAEESAANIPAARPSPALPKTTPKPKIDVPDGGLVMFEGGNVVFRAGPEGKPQPEIKASELRIAPEQTSHPAANGYVLKRVVPQYPVAARQQGTHGPVVLNVLVAGDGSVQDVKVSSGDPALVEAAVEAVKQWRFQPQQVKGKPVEFETRITVNFSLPQVVDNFTPSTGRDRK